MTKTTRRSFMAVLLVLAMMTSYIPASAAGGVSPSTSLPDSGTAAAMKTTIRKQKE